MADRAGAPTSGWLAGLLLGALTGLTTISFAIGLLGLPILVASVLLIVWKGPRLVAGAGLVTGWGLVWTVLLIQSTASCLTFERGPDRWCEPGDVTPWLIAGGTMFALGLLASLAAFRRAGLRR